MKIQTIFFRLKQPIHLQWFIFLLSCWMVVPFNLAFLNKLAQFTPYAGVAAWLFVLAMSLVLLAYFMLMLNLLLWRSVAKPMVLILLFLAGGSAYFTHTFGVSIDAYQIQNAFETDWREVLDLMTFKMGLWLVSLIVLPIIFFCSLKIKQQPIIQMLWQKLAMMLLSLLLIAGLAFVYYVDLASILREHRDLKGYIGPQNILASTWSYYKKLAPKKHLPLVKYGEDAKRVAKNAQALPKLMILVVGETARAESFSLNGYVRNTNPELAKLPMINFSQVSSCGTATAVSLPCMFSGMQRGSYDAQLASHRENALDLLQRAGYKVTWMDNNSGCKGVCERVENYQFSPELKQKWCQDNECYDEILIDGLKDYFTQIPANDTTPRVIVLHQMGSHGPAYYKRSTAAYQHFKPFCTTNAIQGCSQQDLLNVYDNSIVYTDHVLAQVIQLLQQQSHYQTAFWYLSDHGESTGEHGLYLHGAPYIFAPSQQTHIPMLMWFSEQWQQAQPQHSSCLSQQQHRKMSQDDLFSTLLSLMDVESQVKHVNLDLLQQCTR